MYDTVVPPSPDLVKCMEGTINDIHAHEKSSQFNVQIERRAKLVQMINVTLNFGADGGFVSEIVPLQGPNYPEKDDMLVAVVSIAPDAWQKAGVDRPLSVIATAHSYQTPNPTFKVAVTLQAVLRNAKGTVKGSVTGIECVQDPSQLIVPPQGPEKIMNARGCKTGSVDILCTFRIPEYDEMETIPE